MDPLQYSCLENSMDGEAWCPWSHKESDTRRPEFYPWVREDPLQYSCLDNTMDRAAWRATVHGVAKSWTQLSD